MNSPCFKGQLTDKICYQLREPQSQEIAQNGSAQPEMNQSTHWDVNNGMNDQFEFGTRLRQERLKRNRQNSKAYINELSEDFASLASELVRFKNVRIWSIYEARPSKLPYEDDFDFVVSQKSSTLIITLPKYNPDISSNDSFSRYRDVQNLWLNCDHFSTAFLPSDHHKKSLLAVFMNAVAEEFWPGKDFCQDHEYVIAECHIFPKLDPGRLNDIPLQLTLAALRMDDFTSLLDPVSAISNHKNSIHNPDPTDAKEKREEAEKERKESKKAVPPAQAIKSAMKKTSGER